MWPESLPGMTVELSCYADQPLLLLFSVPLDVYESRTAQRFCNGNGSYEEPDVRDCDSKCVQ